MTTWNPRAEQAVPLLQRDFVRVNHRHGLRVWNSCVHETASLTPRLTGAGARSAEGTNTGHENGEAMASVGVRVEPTVRLVADARTHEFRPARYSHAALRLVQLMQETSPAWMRDVEGGQLVRRHSWGTCLRELFPRRTHRMCIQMNKCVLLWTLEEEPCRSTRSLGAIEACRVPLC